MVWNLNQDIFEGGVKVIVHIWNLEALFVNDNDCFIKFIKDLFELLVQLTQLENFLNEPWDIAAKEKWIATSKYDGWQELKEELDIIRIVVIKRSLKAH